MEILPTSRETIPEAAETEAAECPECGTEGYLPAARSPPRSVPRCEGCQRERVREWLDPDTDTGIDRLRAMEEARDAGLLPIEDPASGELLHHVQVEHSPERHLRRAVWVTPIECPGCGHDRGDRRVWRAYTHEHGEAVVCRLCDQVIEEASTL